MAGGRDIGVTESVDNWSFQENYVERLMDDAAYTAAHPNNTLVLAGPARFPSGVANPGSTLLPLGMLQNFSVAQQRPVQPMMALGSGRSFFTAGKGQVSFSLSRLSVDGRNILRALYTQAIQSNLPVQDFDERPVRANREEQAYMNLDSELFYIPFGIAVLLRSVSHSPVAAYYIENAMITSFQTGWGAGQNMIVDSISGIADRVRPIYPNTLTGSTGAPTAQQISSAMLGQPGASTSDLSSR